ncbi:MAG: hypothetical protein MK312_06430 [Roseibacillus sp.]|nr:hypothetical protein [Roseibacillus sp.]
MSKYDGEEILVVPRSLFDELGSFQGLTTDTDRYISTLLDPSNNFFMDRETAEDDPSHKQIIPYSSFATAVATSITSGEKPVEKAGSTLRDLWGSGAI